MDRNQNPDQPTVAFGARAQAIGQKYRRQWRGRCSTLPWSGPASTRKPTISTSDAVPEWPHAGPRQGSPGFGHRRRAALLEVAQKRVPNADLRQGDLETLPFDDNAFHAVTGFNPVQFAANTEKALADAGCVYAPGGTVAVVTWGDSESKAAATLLAALRPLLPPPVPSAPGPFALSNEAALRRFAQEAGLILTEMFDVDCPFIRPSKRHFVVSIPPECPQRQRKSQASGR